MNKIDALTPKEIVRELDRYIIGQDDAKRFVAVALRNRWRRQQVEGPLREEITPKNIIMIGPTGVGKTEIARRLASLTQSPFLKVEASKFTEVGYVGRDVESMVRDLTELAIVMVKEEERQQVMEKAAGLAEERLLDILVPMRPTAPPPAESETTGPSTREKFRQMLRDGKLDDRTVEIEVDQSSSVPMGELFGGPGMEDFGSNLKDAFGKMFPGRPQKRRLPVPEAFAALKLEETNNLIDMDKVKKLAIRRTEESGIIFLDEIDKIASRQGQPTEPMCRAGGVQRDLLPIVEGSTVTTKHGMVKTDHILFIASGAFHLAKPADLIPELQGRFPLRVELNALSEEDFFRILTEPQNALIKQYIALMGTEGVELAFDDDAIRAMAGIAAQVNTKTENIGARRLHTILERVLEELSFAAPEISGQRFVVTAGYVRKVLTDIAQDEDLSRFIL